MTMSQLFWEFNGRIPRKIYILSSLFLMLLGGGISYLLLPVFGLTMEEYIGEPTLKALTFNVMMNALFFWPNLAVGYKRMHDLGWSGKFFGFLYLMLLLLYLLAAVGFFSDNPMQNTTFLNGNFLLTIGLFMLLIPLIFFRGTKGENVYGPELIVTG